MSHMDVAKEYERIAAAIMNDPDWMADESIDDCHLINALNEAAELRRAKHIEQEQRADAAFKSL